MNDKQKISLILLLCFWTMLFGLKPVEAKLSFTARDKTMNFRLKHHHIFFDTVNGTYIKPQVTDSSGKIIEPLTPERIGYKFTGWFKDPENTQPWNFENDRASENLTLYAGWEIINYVITYDLDGGVNHPENPTIYNINSEVFLYNPTRPGYKFLQWSEESRIRHGSIGNRHFKALWEKNFEK